MGSTHYDGVIRYRGVAGTDLEFFEEQEVGHSPDFVRYFNDFLVEQDYAAADWVITTTEAGAGSATEALAGDELCGALLITNDDADNDLDSLQLTQETFKLASGKKLWWETRVKINDVDQVDDFFGLAVTDTTPLATTDRVGFQFDDEDASIFVITEKDSTETKTDTSSDATDATYVKLGFFWDGSSSVKFYVDRSLVATHSSNVPDDENLCVTFHHQNGEASAQTLTIDYINVVMER